MKRLMKYFGVFLVIISAGLGFASDCTHDKEIIKNFIEKPDINTWGMLEGYINDQSRYCDCSADVVVYFIARLRMYLPNSHALKGITPEEKVNQEKSKMDAAIKRLKKCQSINLHKMYESMMNQEFDEQVKITAEELQRALANK